jgi:hypothetical protein
MSFILELTLFDYALSDAVIPNQCVSKAAAEKLFTFFKSHPLFKWNDIHNNCEARAEAICLVLDAWQVPNFKAWVFSGAFLKKHIGGLKHNWKYHVAALVPVEENKQIAYYVIDPSTNYTLQPIKYWAEMVTEFSHSYYCIKKGEYYIFSHKKIINSNWYTRNKRNRKWLHQGLAGINSLSPKGKSQVCFNKKNIYRAQLQLQALMKLPNRI